MSKARFTEEEIVDSMQVVGLVPVFYHDRVDIAVQVLKCAYEAGVRSFEFTNRGANALNVFKELVNQGKRLDGLALGIGTIMNVQQAEAFLKVGADFIVSPMFKQEIATHCNRAKRLWIPGCATITEVVNAMDAGASLVKIFPASVLGPTFVSSVLPVIPTAKLMPTGGVEPTLENLTAWFKVGVTCVGIGSQLFSKESAQDPSRLAMRVKTLIGTIDNIRKSKM